MLPFMYEHLMSELSRVTSTAVWNDKMVGHQAASGQVSVLSAIFLEFAALKYIPDLLCVVT